ncbi:MAG TPA: transposase [Candidatus Sulfotelmatobacter sp.]|nr:transposase [Candidatus Sulfotelmatobacter sp.]
MGRSLSRRQFCTGEKGGSAIGKTKRGKGTKWMVLVDGKGIPLGVRLESASPNEVTLAEATLDQVRVPRCKGRPRHKPQRVIADRPMILIRFVSGSRNVVLN